MIGAFTVMSNSAWYTTSIKTERIKETNPCIWIEAAERDLINIQYESALQNASEALGLTDDENQKFVCYAIMIDAYYGLYDTESARSLYAKYKFILESFYLEFRPEYVIRNFQIDAPTWEIPFYQLIDRMMQDGQYNDIKKYIDIIDKNHFCNIITPEFILDVFSTDDTPIYQIIRSTGFNFENLNFEFGNTALMVAVELCDDFNIVSDVIKISFKSIDDTNDYGETALHCAVRANKGSFIKLLLDAKANVNAKDIEGNTPLHQALFDDNPEIAEILLNATIDVNVRNKKGEWLLNVAVDKNYYEVVEKLLKRGANVNATDTQGNSTIFHAVLNSKEMALISLILKYNPDINLLNKNNNSVLKEACCCKLSEKYITALLEAGANPNAYGMQVEGPLFVVAEEGTTYILDILIMYGAELEALGQNGDDFLYRACKSKNSTIFVYATEKYSDRLCLYINRKHYDICNGSLLHYIASNKHWDNCMVSMYEALLGTSNIDLDMKDDDGNTPLMLSVDHRWIFSDELGMARALVSAGANTRCSNHYGRSLDDILRKRNIRRSKLFNNESSNWLSKLFD